MSTDALGHAVVQVRRVLPVGREEAFRAWTDPRILGQWFKPRGGTSAGVEMDLRVGGRYRWGLKLLAHTYYAAGEFVEIDPPKRLVFTFGWEHAIVRLQDSLVTVEFNERGDETEVVITHERLRRRGMRTLHRVGWQGLMKDLEHLLKAAS